MMMQRRCLTMWRRSLSAGYRCFECRRGGPKGIWSSPAVRACSMPACPAGRITALEAIDLWKRCFEKRGVAEPEHSSQYIIAHLLGAKTIESVEQERLTEFLSQEQTEQVWKLCSKRLSSMPVQYVIEEWDFRDLTLKMRPPVFIPRPETEELVELVLADLQMKSGTQHTCLEVGCGSGAISLSLLKSVPQLKAFALDQSQEAVDLTTENMFRLGLQDRLQIHHIDVMKDAQSVLSLCSSVSALVSNPPYLFSEDMASLQPDIFRFEDHAALDGGTDGLNVIKQILTLAPQILSSEGRVYLEVDPRHPPLIRRWVEVNVEELQYVETRHDISGRPRFCILQKEKSNKDHELDLN
ncbi:MTRF1L release factor glutamine methyltransferase [Parambassis ranga]|uniref:peptide chain release factor N(5)-glutamine methyltransferase n=1 Tax=Parambassis ranga TaxID=210632 RepID=A0A6P7I7V6_9TELE|nr:hemK methyltransferase family member 1 [Parambassis ranga]XP_028261859.1 hemK methyltransferase family member 1 [Parambassis ranga]